MNLFEIQLIIIFYFCHGYYSKAAAMVPVREITREISQRAVLGNQQQKKKSNDNKKSSSSLSSSLLSSKKTKIRPVNENDFKEALKKVKRTGEAAQSFLRRENSTSSSSSSPSPNVNNVNVNLAQAMQMMNLMLSASQQEQGQNNDEKEDDIPSIN